MKALVRAIVYGAVVSLGLIFLCGSQGAVKGTAKQPNIVIILADDFA